MQGENSEQLMGRIIFANVLAQPLWKYFTFAEKIESHSLFEQWYRRGLVWKENLSRLSAFSHPPTKKEGVIGKYVKHGRGKYEIQYYHSCFQLCYGINEDLLHSFSDGSAEKRLLHKIRQVNSRNVLSYNLLNTIAKEQRDYLSSGNILHLMPLTQVKLAKIMSQNMNSLNIHALTNSHVCHSWLSRLITNLTVKLPDDSLQSLNILLPTQRDCTKSALLDLLNVERRRIFEGTLHIPHSDRKLRELLHNKFHITTSHRNITYIRHELGISSARTRDQDFWYFLSVPFSRTYSFMTEVFDLHVPPTTGVYEIGLNKEQITYPNGPSNIIYIGRAKNLRKRLKEHLLARTRNRIIAQYLKRGSCSIRFFITNNSYIQEEKRLYDLFISMFGAPPIGNRISPGG